MKLKKRIEALEEKQHQMECTHSFGLMTPLGITIGRDYFVLAAKCYRCNKEIEKIVQLEPFKDAFNLMLEEIKK